MARREVGTPSSDTCLLYRVSTERLVGGAWGGAAGGIVDGASGGGTVSEELSEGAEQGGLDFLHFLQLHIF